VNEAGRESLVVFLVPADKSRRHRFSLFDAKDGICWGRDCLAYNGSAECADSCRLGGWRRCLQTGFNTTLVLVIHVVASQFAVCIAQTSHSNPAFFNNSKLCNHLITLPQSAAPIPLSSISQRLGLAWGAYIAKDPSLFVAQFLGNAQNRMAAGYHAVWIFKGELWRYKRAFGFARYMILV
jgi:hypothetical protein